LRWDPSQWERSHAEHLEYLKVSCAALRRMRWPTALNRRFVLRSFALRLQVLRSVPYANVARRSPCSDGCAPTVAVAAQSRSCAARRRFAIHRRYLPHLRRRVSPGAHGRNPVSRGSDGCRAWRRLFNELGSVTNITTLQRLSVVTL